MPQREAKKVSRFRRIGAWTILGSIFSSPIVVSAFNLKEKVDKMEVKISVLEKDNDKVEKKINQIHWFLIKKNNVEVPDDADAY